MAIIKVENNLTDDAQKTYLAVGQAIGVGTLYVKNTNGFNGSWAVQVGETGKDRSEIVIGTGISGTNIILSGTTLYDHPADTPVYSIKWNQVIFQKSTTGTAGTATAITNGTIAIQPDDYDPADQKSYTRFDDTAGTSTDAYRSVFRASTLNSNSSQSDWFVPSGATFYSLASLTNRVREKLWDSNFITKDSIIYNWINEFKDEMSNLLISTNESYAMGTVDVGFGTAGLGTVTTTDFNQIRRLEVTYNGNDYFLSGRMDIKDYLPDQQFSSVHPYHAWRGDTIFQIKPEEQGGTARIYFYRFGTTMVNSTDELPLPMRSYTKAFIDYSLSQAYFKDGKLNESRTLTNEVEKAKLKFQAEVSARDKSGPRYIDIVDAISGEDHLEGSK